MKDIILDYFNKKNAKLLNIFAWKTIFFKEINTI